VNKFEKEAFNALSEEEQNKIAGGSVNANEEMTEDQCNELKKAVFKIDDIDKEKLEALTKCIAYGCPMPNIPDFKTILQKKQDIDTDINNQL